MTLRAPKNRCLLVMLPDVHTQAQHLLSKLISRGTAFPRFGKHVSKHAAEDVLLWNRHRVRVSVGVWRQLISSIDPVCGRPIADREVAWHVSVRNTARQRYIKQRQKETKSEDGHPPGVCARVCLRARMIACVCVCVCALTKTNESLADPRRRHANSPEESALLSMAARSYGQVDDPRSQPTNGQCPCPLSRLTVAPCRICDDVFAWKA